MQTKIVTSHDRITFRAFDDTGETTLRINRNSVTLKSRLIKNTAAIKSKFADLEKRIGTMFNDMSKQDVTNAEIIDKLTKEVEVSASNQA